MRRSSVESRESRAPSVSEPVSVSPEKLSMMVGLVLLAVDVDERTDADSRELETDEDAAVDATDAESLWLLLGLLCSGGLPEEEETGGGGLTTSRGFLRRPRPPEDDAELESEPRASGASCLRKLKRPGGLGLRSAREKSGMQVRPAGGRWEWQ